MFLFIRFPKNKFDDEIEEVMKRVMTTLYHDTVATGNLLSLSAQQIVIHFIEIISTQLEIEIIQRNVNSFTCLI